MLDHSLEWLKRKHQQAQKEKWEARRVNIIDGVRSLALIIDGAFNNGKGHDDIMLPPFEEAAAGEGQPTTNSKFVTGTWWKGGTDDG